MSDFSWRSVFAGLDEVSSDIQGLSSTDCNFQGLSRCVRTLKTESKWKTFQIKNDFFCKKDIKTEHEQNAFVTNFFSFAD